MGNKLQESVADSDSCITYTPLSLLASTSSEITYIQFHRRKVVEQKVFAKKIDSFKMKFDKIVIILKLY